MRREVKAEKLLPNFFILIMETALRVASTGRKEKTEKMMRVIFEPDFDAGEPGR